MKDLGSALNTASEDAIVSTCISVVINCTSTDGLSPLRNFLNINLMKKNLVDKFIRYLILIFFVLQDVWGNRSGKENTNKGAAMSTPKKVKDTVLRVNNIVCASFILSAHIKL